MKQKKAKLSALLLGLGLAAQAQQATVTAGGDASGSGGTVAYSVGQVVYSTGTSAAGSVAQGVQQPYEISVVSVMEDPQLSIDVQVYPNPTTDQLILSIGSSEVSDLSYQLFSLGGQFIESQKIAGTSATIRMETLQSATYFLNVTSDNKTLKSFKIIKY